MNQINKIISGRCYVGWMSASDPKFLCLRQILSIPRERSRGALIAALLALTGLTPAFAAVQVVDQSGQPVANALVIDLESAEIAPGRQDSATIYQRDQEFEPRFSAIARGTAVEFPNQDRSRHHVYSFSPARTFEIQLYRGIPSEPIVFDRPGLVTLGCNLHDWMIGYVYIAEHSRFAMTSEAGLAELPGADSGDALLDVRHPYLLTPFEPQRASAARQADGTVRLIIDLQQNIVLPQRPDQPQQDRRRDR